MNDNNDNNNNNNKSIVSRFPWDHCKSQEKIIAMLMQNFGGTNKKYYGFFDIGK